MKHSKFISVVIATLLLFCSADAFAQRSRGGSGSSGGRVESGSRSVSISSSSSNSSSNSYGGGSSKSYSSSRSYSSTRSSCCGHSDRSYSVTNSVGYKNSTNYYGADENYVFVTGPSAVSVFDAFSNYDILNSYFPVYGHKVGKRTATKESLLIPRQAGDYYYRDGIFFSKSLNSNRRFVIDKPCSGLRVPDIPASRNEYIVNGVSYYYYYGTFYIYDASTSEYVVVTPPVGLVVNSMPAYAMKIVINDNSYYVVDNVLYKAIRSEGKEKYEVTNLDRKTMYYIKDYFASAK